MKTKKQTMLHVVMIHALTTAAIICSASIANAQSWNLAGNSDATASTFLGTTNRQPLIIKTDNITRATFNAGGNLTMATNINFNASSRSIIFPATSGTVNAMIYMFASGTTNANRMVLAHSSAYSAWGLQYQDNGDKFNFLRDGANVMTIDLGNKRVGITTNAPAYPLHVTGSNTTAYVTSDFLSPDGAAMKVEYHGVGLNYGARALYATATTGNATATAGFFQSDFIAVDGHASSGGSGAYGLSGVASGSGSTFSFGAYGKASNDFLNYGLYGEAFGGTTRYALYANGNIGGTGTFSYTSDEKLKKDIQPLAKSLEKIMALKPTVYQFRTGEFGNMNLPEGKHFGLIAQNVQKLLPELVSKQVFPPQYDEQHHKIHDAIDYLGLNYTELIPVIIAAMQEQQTQIAQRDYELESLRKQVEELRNSITAISQNTQSVSSADMLKTGGELAYLKQNIPNPAKGNTEINYYVPASVQQAAIAVYDGSGKQVRFYKIQAGGNGSIILSAQNLSSGVYRCNLLVNGHIADSKNMQLVK